jgi:hypothetical protein
VPRAAKDPNQAVVLTLRKRYSIHRGTRQVAAGSRDFVVGGLSSNAGVQEDSGATADPAVANNPWEDARPSLTPVPLHHRLSFDHASGVIMLPEDGDWLVEDVDSDEEEDYGTENGLEHSQVETIAAENPSSPPVASAMTLSPSRSSRYGTYFHHPERRRQPIPGAFPR